MTKRIMIEPIIKMNMRQIVEKVLIQLYVPYSSDELHPNYGPPNPDWMRIYDWYEKNKYSVISHFCPLSMFSIRN